MISAQYHVVFDYWCATIAATKQDLLDFNSDECMRMFGDSSLQYVYDEHNHDKSPSPEDTATQHKSDAALDRVLDASHQAAPPVPLSIPMPQTVLMSEPQADSPQAVDSPSPEPVCEVQQREEATIESSGSPRSEATLEPSPVSSPESSPLTSIVPSPRPVRNRQVPTRFGFDQSHGYLAQWLSWPFNSHALHLNLIKMDWELPLAEVNPSYYKAAVSDPDTLSYKKAMFNAKEVLR